MPKSMLPLRGDEIVHVVQGGMRLAAPLADVVEAAVAADPNLIDDWAAKRGLIPTLTSTLGKSTAGAAPGVAVATVSGFMSGEKLAEIRPADGRLAVNPAGTGIVTGAIIGLFGVREYTLLTTAGRKLAFQFWATA